MLRATVLSSYVIFILGTALWSLSLPDECWPACANPTGNQAMVNQKSCADSGDSCCSETSHVAPLPAKPSLSHPAFGFPLTRGTGFEATPDAHDANGGFLVVYTLAVWRPPSHLIPLRI